MSKAGSGGARASIAPVFWISAALVVLTVSVYAPVRHFDFVPLDDPLYVSENPQVSAGLTWSGVQWAFTTGTAANWHPLTWLSLMADVTLFGVAPGPAHVVNLLLHIGSTLLLFALLRRMTGAVWRSAVVAALFAVHPLHVESVAWIAERKDVLSAFLGLLTIWAYVSYTRAPGIGRYALVLCWFALGLLAKPMLVTLPFVLLLLDRWPLGRSAAWLEKLPLVALSAASSVVTFLVQRAGGALADIQHIPFSDRIAGALVSYVAYLRQMVWPSGLMVIYPLQQASAGRVIVACLVLAAITAAALLTLRSRPYLAVGWCWYLGMLVPVLGLVQVGVQSRADRYTYLPLIGVFIAMSWGVHDLLTRAVTAARTRALVAGVAAGVAVLASTIVARQQVGYWQDGVALWQRATELSLGVDAYRAHVLLGNTLRDQGRLDEAIAHFAEAVRLRPDLAEAQQELGLALQNRGRLDEAIAHYQDALRLKPGGPELENNLGSALASADRIPEARPHFAEAVRLKPDFDLARLNLAIADLKLGRRDEAIAGLREVLRRNPAEPRARALLDQATRGGGAQF